MFEGLQITFAVNRNAYGISIENDNYMAYVGIKRNKSDNQKKRLKPYRRYKKYKN